MDNLRGAAADRETPASGIGLVQRLDGRTAAPIDTREAPTSGREVARVAEMDGVTREVPMSTEVHASVPTSTVQETSQMDDLSFNLGALEMREAFPRLDVMRLMRMIRMDARRLKQIIPMELSMKLFRMQSDDGELHKSKEKVTETEDICFVKDVVQKMSSIESYMDAVEKEFKERPVEDDEISIHLSNMQGHKVMMISLKEDMKKFVAEKLLIYEGHSEEAFSHPTSMISPILPPLPDFEVNVIPRQMKTKGSSSSSDSDTDTSSSDCSEIERLDDIYSLDGPSWEALTAETKFLATDEEEESMMMDAAIPLGSDLVASQMITLFEKSTNELGHRGTSRAFLENLPLLYVCKNNKCSICRASFPLKDRCARLPCMHCFHVRCILEWLVKKTTCPMCRHKFPSR